MPRSRPFSASPTEISLRPSLPEVNDMVPVPKSGIVMPEVFTPKPLIAVSTLSISALSIVIFRLS